VQELAPMPFARLTLVFSLGILSCRYAAIPHEFSYFILLSAYLGVAISFRKKLFSNSHLVGILGLLTIYLGGWSIYSNQLQTENPHLNSPKLLESESFLLWLNKPLDKKGERNRGIAEIIGFQIDGNWKKCNHRILVTLTGDVDGKLGDLLVVKSHPDTIKNFADNLEFDFKAYYALQGIYLTQYITPKKVIAKSVRDIPLHQSLAFNTRIQIEQTIDKYFGDSQSGGVLKALTIGQKSDLDPDVKENFSNSGTMHVLAVSGLHVGIFYGIFLFIFNKLINTRWKYLIISFIVIQLWFYALITGLSPSVVRAVTMFSILALGKLIDRRSNAFNLVFASAFMILLFKPGLLFSVGFQLSYLAVLSILFFGPKLTRAQPVWIPPKLWTLLAISLAAQIGTLPLSLYYFKQFPTYFLLSNLLVIPAVFIILNGAILFIAIGFIDFLQQGLAYLLDKFVNMMLLSVELLNKLPFNVITTRVFDAKEVILLYLLICSLSIFWLKRKYSWLIYSCALICVFFVSRIFTLWKYYH